MDAVALLQAGSALLLNIGFCWLIGSWFARRWLQSSGVARNEFESGLGRLDVAAAALAAAGGALSMWAATAGMAGVSLGEAWPMLWMMLSTTSYGHAGLVAIFAMAVVFGLRLWRTGSGAGGAAVIAAISVFAVTRASMGHAGENGLWSTTLLAEAVHYLAIGLWTGAVAVSGWFVMSESQAASLAAKPADQYLERMSRAAMYSVIAILVTGAYSSWHRVGTTEHLLHSVYGWTLLAKIALVLLALALGGYNKFIGLPLAAQSASGAKVVRAVLQVETFLLLGALLAASVLTSQQPPTAM